jgi:hypothetical protein
MTKLSWLFELGSSLNKKRKKNNAMLKIGWMKEKYDINFLWELRKNFKSRCYLRDEMDPSGGKNVKEKQKELYALPKLSLKLE